MAKAHIQKKWMLKMREQKIENRWKAIVALWLQCAHLSIHLSWFAVYCPILWYVVCHCYCCCCCCCWHCHFYPFHIFSFNLFVVQSTFSHVAQFASIAIGNRSTSALCRSGCLLYHRQTGQKDNSSSSSSHLHAIV